MIKSLELKNFRSHEHSKLEFHPGVNVIVGLPNRGKTNIMRAFRWVLLNRPTGARVRSRFSSKATKVTVGVDGKSVSLVAGKKGKRYEIAQDGVVKKYKAVGTGVPDLVSRTLNISEVSVQGQHDRPFLVMDSPSEVSRVLNRVTRLERVDGWIKKLNSRLLSKGKEKSVLEGQVREKREKLEALKGLSRLKRELDGVEESAREVAILSERVAQLDELITGVAKGTVAVKRYRDTGPLLNECEVALRELGGIDNLRERIGRLDELVPDIRASVAKVNELDKQIVEQASRYKSLLLEKKQCPFCPFCTTEIKKHNVEKLLEAV